MYGGEGRCSRIIKFLKIAYQILQNLKKTKIIYRLMPVTWGSDDLFTATRAHRQIIR